MNLHLNSRFTFVTCTNRYGYVSASPAFWKLSDEAMPRWIPPLYCEYRWHIKSTRGFFIIRPPQYFSKNAVLDFSYLVEISRSSPIKSVSFLCCFSIFIWAILHPELTRMSALTREFLSEWSAYSMAISVRDDHKSILKRLDNWHLRTSFSWSFWMIHEVWSSD